MYSAEVVELKAIMAQARTMEMIERACDEPDKAKIIDAVKIRKNAQAKIEEITAGHFQFNAIHIK